MLITAVAWGLIGGLGEPPRPQSYRIWVESMKCIEETSEASASDETYVVAYIADRSRIGKSDLAAYQGAFMKGPIENTDAGETKSLNIRLWHPKYSAGRPIPNADDILIACCLMEHDDERTSDLAQAVEEKCMASLLYTNLGLRPSREAFARAIKAAMDETMDIDHGDSGGEFFSNEDDRIGPSFGVHFTNSDLAAAKPVRKSVTVAGDGGKYTVTFRLERSPG